tara:strand:+ start:436 stop:987 length:552 start_codon:yes stop_codon:yes gene_type:complete
MALNTFIARLTKESYQRQNKYRVQIYGPWGAMGYDMALFAETVEIPGQTVISSPDELRYGPPREQATAISYGPTNITFICTPGMPEREFFTNWQGMIVNKNSWEAHYYEEYAARTSINVYALDAEEKDQYGVTLYEVFPKTISGQSFGAGSNDSYQTLDVEFAFRYWKEMSLSGPYSSSGQIG